MFAAKNKKFQTICLQARLVEPEEEIEAEPEEVVTEPITEPEEETTEVQA